MGLLFYLVLGKVVLGILILLVVFNFVLNFPQLEEYVMGGI